MAKVNLFHKILLDEKYITEQQLQGCLEEIRNNPELKLGRVLLNKKYLTETQLREIANRVKTEMAQAGDLNQQEQKAQAASQSQMGIFIEEAAREKLKKGSKSIKEIVSETGRTDYKSLITICVCIVLLLGFGAYQLMQDRDSQSKPMPTPPPIAVEEKPNPALVAAEQRQANIEKSISTRQVEIEKILSRPPAITDGQQNNKNTFEARQTNLLEDSYARIDALVTKTEQSPLEKMEGEARQSEALALENQLFQIAAGLETLKNIAESKAAAQKKIALPDVPVVIDRKHFDQLLKLASLPEAPPACVALVCLEKVATDMPDYGAEKVYAILASSKTRDLRHGALKCLIAWASKTNQRSLELVRLYMNGKISRDEVEEVGKLIFAARKAELIGVENLRETVTLHKLFKPLRFMLEKPEILKAESNPELVGALQTLRESLLQFLTDAPNKLRAKKEIYQHFESVSDCLKATDEGVVENAFVIVLFCLTDQKDDIYRKVVDTFSEIVDGNRSIALKIQTASDLLPLQRDKEILDIVAGHISITAERLPEVREAYCDLLAKWAPNENTVADLAKNFVRETDPKVIDTINGCLSRLLGDAGIKADTRGIYDTYSEAARSGDPNKSLAALEFISFNLDKLADGNPALREEVVTLAAERLSSADPRVYQTAFAALGNLCTEPNSLPENARQILLNRLNKTDNDSEFKTLLAFLSVSAPNAVEGKFLKDKLLWALQEPREKGDRGFVPHEPRWMMVDAIEVALLANFQPSYIDDLRLMVTNAKPYPSAGMMYSTGGRRERVVRMIARFPDELATETLIQIFDASPDKASVELRQVIAQSLAQRPGDKAVQYLADIFKRDDDAFRSLARVPGPNISRAIVKCLRENPPDSPIYKKCAAVLEDRHDDIIEQYLGDTKKS